MKAYNCPSCGAELICDASTAATSCPYCGNPTVVPGQFSGALKPDYVIPLKLSKEDAVAALTLTVPAWAEQQPGDPFIYDTAGLLSDGDRAYLEQMADAISWQYQCGVYIVTVDDYEVYGSDCYSAALNIYRGNDFGIGDGRDGIMLICLLLKAKMKSVRKGAEADVYVTAEGLDLTERYDRYTHTTETRVRKNTRDHDSGGGGHGSGGKF